MGAIFWIAVLVAALILFKSRRKSLPLPPGPPADPIIGHFRHITSDVPAETFAEWSKLYGDVMHLRVFGRNMIILNSTEAAVDLMDKRSANYNHRPDFPIFRLMGWDQALALTITHGKKFQKHRRLIQQIFTRQKIEQYEHIQTREARRLALNLLERPNDREAMLSRFSTSIVMQFAFGHEVVSDDDTYLEIAKGVRDAFTYCGPIGSTAVDLFPLLEHMPSWFPGTFFANKARELKPSIRKLHDFPFVDVQRQMAEGVAKPSFLSHHLERLHREGNENEEEFEDIKGAAGSIYSAAADTTWGTLSAFVLAMVLHPECQKRAQEELDGLLGGSRLPELGDRKTLPYVECVLQETHRWLATTPLGIPHCVVEDDIYRGMLIPKGSFIFANAYGISRNESVYHDPNLFKPSRFLPKSQGGHGEPFPQAQFGFGRRICPGRHFANANLFLALSTVLVLFDLKKPIGADGKEIIPEVSLISGLTSHIKPYETKLRMRNENARKLMNQIKVELVNE